MNEVQSGEDPKLSHPRCFESEIEMENCLLECMSPECYSEVYRGDALEEGEVDIVRYMLVYDLRMSLSSLLVLD